MKNNTEEARKSIEKALKDYEHIKGHIDEIKARVAEYKRLIDAERHLTGVSYDGIGGGYGVSDPTFKAVASIMTKFAAQITRDEQRLDKLHSTINRIETLLEVITPEERGVIECLYFKGFSFKRTSAKCNYHESHVYRLRNAAIEKMVDAMNHDSK